MAVDWRKVWTELPPEVEPLPAITRGIYVEAYRFAEDDGVVTIIPPSLEANEQTAADEIAFRLRARPAEGMAVVEAALKLLKVGAFKIDGRAVVIKDFAEIQDRKSTAAEQKAKQRARKRQTLQLGETDCPPESVDMSTDRVGTTRTDHEDVSQDTSRTCPPGMSGVSTSNVHDETRQEETRESRSPAGAGGASDPPGGPRARRRATSSPPGGFDAFWAIYPRRMHRAEAEKAFEKQIRSPEDLERLLAHARGFAAAAERDAVEERFIALPATYLNKRRWTDGTAAPAVPTAAPATAAAGGAPVATMPNGRPWPRDLARLFDGKPPPEQAALVARLRVAEPFRFEPDGSAKF